MVDGEEDDRRGPPPTRDRLSAALGFAVPDDLVKLACFAYEEAGPSRDRTEVGTVLLGTVGFDLDPAIFGEPAAERYYVPAPEYVPFGWTGFDGVSFGFLVHAPELAGVDWPLVVADPYRQDEGARHLADSFRRALEHTASWPLRGEQQTSAEQEARRARLKALFRIAPSVAKARNFGRRPARAPSAPRGWRHLPLVDGVGVLAPSGAFAPGHRGTARSRGASPRGEVDLDAVVSAARRHLARGHPASALAVANDGYHRAAAYCRRDEFLRLRPLRLAAYRALGRNAHARALERTRAP